MKTKQQWKSKLGFILASAGSAIGLGSLWKFPSVVATNGGSVFLLIFIVFTFGIGFPLLLAEFLIGHSTGKEAISAYRELAPKSRWHWIGYLGMATCSLILSFYSVVGGWIILYLLRASVGALLESGRDYGALFQQISANPWEAVLAQGTFMFLTMIIVARGVKHGIEQASQILMPGLFLLLIVLIGRALTLPGMWEGLIYFLQPNFNLLSTTVLLDALGQSFFCLSVGGSCMVTYSSYLQKNEPLGKPTMSVVFLNIMTSFMAGIAIFPTLFALKINLKEGPGLLFVTLPAVFEQLSYGSVFITIFLILFLFATLTSAFSLLEIIVAALIHKNTKRRKKMCWLLGTCIFILGIPSALSFGIGNDFKWLNKNVFEWVEFAVTKIMLPLGVFLISIFVGFRFPQKHLQIEWSKESTWLKKRFSVYTFLLRFVIPIVVILVFLTGMNWLPI